MQHLSLLSALKYLTNKIEGMEAKLDTLCNEIAEARQEWNQEFEFEIDSGEESDDESEDGDGEESDTSVGSTQSAPATFSYKRQRTS